MEVYVIEGRVLFHRFKTTDLSFTIQASLGTTKYCSYFLKSMQCPKPDCMYLHELGDEAASFTKEEMQVKFVPFLNL